MPPAPKPRWWLRFLVVATVVALIAGAAVAVRIAAAYQPLEFGGSTGIGLPGMPEPVGTRMVNTFGGSDGQLYVPPQDGPFSISESLTNHGPWSVTILEVNLTGPESVWPVNAAGSARWVPEFGPRPATSQPVHGVVLHPHQYIDVGMLLQMPTSCYQPDGWTRIDFFWVKERFLTFTHWVQLPLGMPVVMHEPETHGAICP